jgi:hypothetical protein
VIETIRDSDRMIALIIRSGYRASGIEFFTPDDFPQQMAYMNRPAGYRVEPHLHRELPRRITRTQEVLVIRRGRVRVDYFSDDRVYLSSSVLETGDVILLASGGHGFAMLEQTEMIEIKQGPYAGDRDKVRFSPGDHTDG